MLHVLHMIDSLCIGGAEKLLVTFAHAARERQLDVTVVSLRHAAHTPIPDELRQQGAHVRIFHATKLLHPPRMWQLIRFLQQQSIDVIQTHLTSANIIGTLTGRLAKRPVVTTLHNTTAAQHPMRHQLETWALRYGAHQIVAVGQNVAQTHQHRAGPTPMSVVPNAVHSPPPFPDHERDAIRARLMGDTSQILLISVGSLTPQKGFTDLLEAFALLRQTHPAAVLAIAGDGNLRDHLNTRVHQLQLEDHVRLLGPRHDVPALLAASDVYVSSSHWEGLPVSILEAMATGLPIVATHVGDIPHLVPADSGILVPPKQPEALAQALSPLCDDASRRHTYGAAGRAHVAQHYDANRWVNQLITVYKEAQASARPDRSSPRSPHE
ncbi:glycosyltransferase [Candidatus Entotheonella palauensis]|uniref:glycosyltransferase n=1 Tax=Candidatus Entotheonella palauensis TaxID=93172 RepID=UPI000B7E02EC|nr:glycosyltransferase [Candidatus Entotheonella palauensis]